MVKYQNQVLYWCQILTSRVQKKVFKETFRPSMDLPPIKRSNIFLIRIFTVFLDLTDPASKNANPHCIKNTTIPITIRKRLSILLCNDFD